MFYGGASFLKNLAGVGGFKIRNYSIFQSVMSSAVIGEVHIINTSFEDNIDNCQISRSFIHSKVENLDENHNWRISFDSEMDITSSTSHDIIEGITEGAAVASNNNEDIVEISNKSVISAGELIEIVLHKQSFEHIV